MRFTIRFKLFAIVAVAAIALIVLTVSAGFSEHAVEAQVDSIRDTYLPKIRLRPTLTAAFAHFVGTFKNAVDAADVDTLATTVAEHDALLKLVSTSREALTLGESAVLRLGIDDYYAAALAASRRLIEGGGGENTTIQVQQMQAKAANVASLIDEMTTFDDHELAAAFAATQAEQHTAMTVRIVVGAACLVALLAISIWIGIAVFASFGALVAGFERFGRNDFATPIASASRDELSEVASHANKMAEELQRLDLERARNEWVRNGLAGLGD